MQKFRPQQVQRRAVTVGERKNRECSCRGHVLCTVAHVSVADFQPSAKQRARLSRPRSKHVVCFGRFGKAEAHALFYLSWTIPFPFGPHCRLHLLQPKTSIADSVAPDVRGDSSLPLSNLSHNETVSSTALVPDRHL